ncbi:hypothetical protein FHS16_001019 [Paenibacillus endophyticus]|uniref:Uncharacterized protein n=1 Tax=Paenibacillus endophyticus TaxID=1294268 RepID=A0A7W5G8S9_9BACL|nr:hypothetical protein [Paenibacillus endophyticus]MBB3150985.1 hypothetical protein [Paenibacillus endophyticus]
MTAKNEQPPGKSCRELFVFAFAASPKQACHAKEIDAHACLMNP